MAKNTPRNTTYYGWWMVLLMCYTLFHMGGIAFYTFAVFLKPFEEEFGWSRFGMLGSGACWALVLGFSGPFVGAWLQRFGARKVLAVSAVLGGIAAVLLSRMTQLWHLYAISAFHGLAAASSTLVPAQTVVTIWFNKYRGRAMGLTMAGLGLGGLVYPPLCAFVIEHFGWRTAYLVFALISYLLVLPPLLLFVKDRPSDLGLLPDGLESDGEGGKKEHAPAGVSVRRAVRSSNFVLLVGIYLTQLYVISLIGVNTPIFATDAGYSLQVASYFMAFALGVTVIGRFLFGVLCDHVNPKILVAAVGFLLMCSVLVLELCVAKLGWTGYGPVWLFAVFQGLAISGSVIILAILVGRCFGEREFAKIMGLVTAGFAVGVVLGGPSAGYIYDRTGSYEIAFFLCVAVALVSVVLALFVRPYALRSEFGTG